MADYRFKNDLDYMPSNQPAQVRQRFLRREILKIEAYVADNPDATGLTCELRELKAELKEDYGVVL